MNAHVFPSPLTELVDRILTSRQITRLDQRSLLVFTNVSETEQALLNQVCDRLHRGLLRVVD